LTALSDMPESGHTTLHYNNNIIIESWDTSEDTRLELHLISFISNLYVYLTYPLIVQDCENLHFVLSGRYLCYIRGV